MKTETVLNLPLSFIQNFIRLRSLHKYPKSFDERIKRELDEKLEFLLKDGHTAYAKLCKGKCPMCGLPVGCDIGLNDECGIPEHRFCYCDPCGKEFDFDDIESIYRDLLSLPYSRRSD